MAAFADPSIKAIIASIAGDDSIRTLPYTDLSLMRATQNFYGLFRHDDYALRLSESGTGFLFTGGNHGRFW